MQQMHDQKQVSHPLVELLLGLHFLQKVSTAFACSARPTLFSGAPCPLALPSLLLPVPGDVMGPHLCHRSGSAERFRGQNLTLLIASSISLMRAEASAFLRAASSSMSCTKSLSGMCMRPIRVGESAKDVAPLLCVRPLASAALWRDAPGQVAECQNKTEGPRRILSARPIKPKQMAGFPAKRLF